MFARTHNTLLPFLFPLLALGGFAADCEPAIDEPQTRTSEVVAVAGGGDPDLPAIVAWVYNYAHVPEPVLGKTQKEVTRMFGATGVEVTWVRCPISADEVRANPVCQNGMYATELALTIFPKSDDRSLHLASPKGGISDRYFGWAEVFADGHFGHYAYVFYDQVTAPSNRGPASASQVLAVVVAHEFGHLLLRSLAHSSSGLMRERWDRTDLQRAAWGRLQFAPSEAARIRAEAAARLHASRPAW